jgi:cytochrome c553
MTVLTLDFMTSRFHMRRIEPHAIGGLLFMAASLVFGNLAAAADPDGAQVYKARCVACHGPQGEGTAKQKRRLAGDRSVSQLADLIGKTMPEDDPGTLTAEEARAVAEYIFDAFYSPLARERNRPARVELSRLTVRQYRQAVADIIAGFRGPVKWGEERGLSAEYSSGRGFGRRRNGGPAARRTDAQVNFDFGTEAPVPEIEEPHEFSIRWSGSVLAPETGDYEFVVRTDHAARLWINDLEHPLIDAWVKSGTENEFRATQFLLAGRPCPLRLEFSKAKQGVDDSKKQKEKPPSKPAFISLLWKRPQGALETVPARQLSPETVAESFAVTAPFPPDDRSYGWERGTAVSKEWLQATTNAAIETAAYAASRVDELSQSRPGDGARVQKLLAFCRTFAERAFRRPLSEEESQRLIDRQFAAASDPQGAVKRSLILVLESPQFLYREITGSADAYSVASRLSFGLWDSIPDGELLSAAGGGRLASRDDVAQQAERMLTDLRARSKLRGFLLKWLKADTASDLAKDPQKFAGFDDAAINDLRTSLELFLDEVLWSETSDFRQLLLADYVYLNDRLAKFYGVEAPAGDFAKVQLDADRRAGVLAHPYLMARFAHSRESSPIHRGVFLARGVLGQSMPPPPEAVAPLAPDLHPDLTTRERVDLQTRAASCTTCHAIINPLGFTLEHFDAVGRFREFDRGKPVDASGIYRARSGETVKVNGARELATVLAASDEAQGAFIEQLFHHLVQQSVRAYGPTTLADLRRTFVAQGMNIRKLVVAILAETARTGRESKTADVTGRPQ